MLRFEVDAPRDGSAPGEQTQVRFRLIDDTPRIAGAPMPTPMSKPAPKATATATATSRSTSTTSRATTSSSATAGSTSPQVNGSAPKSGWKDAERAASGTKQPAADAASTKQFVADQASVKSKLRATSKHPTSPDRSTSGTSKSSKSLSYAGQLEAKQRQTKVEHERQASVMDSSVTPAERTKLKAEQDAFRGIDRTAKAAAPNEPAPNEPAPNEPAPKSPNPKSPIPKAPTPKDRTAHGAVLTGPSGPGGSRQSGSRQQPQIVKPEPTKQHTDAEWIEFLREREYWIGEDGKPWRVEVGTDGTAALYRDDDPTGIDHLPTIGAVADAPRNEPQISTPGSRSGPGRGPARGPALAVPNQSAIGIDSTPPPSAEGPVASGNSSNVSAVQFLKPDGRIISSKRTVEHWNDGVDKVTLEQTSDGHVDTQRGTERMTTTRATREDGSMAEITHGAQTGIYEQWQRETDRKPGEYSATRVVGADGSVTSFDSRYPRARQTPRTIDELRIAQDTLGSAAERIRTMDTKPADGVDGVFHDAELQAAQIELDELQGVAREGAIGIVRSDPKAMKQYAEASFDEVRDRFAQLGLDATAGNQQIDRDWLSDDFRVRRNAHYDPFKDMMRFGAMGDGTPFAASDDVIAHEFGHRIVEKNGGVTYQGEPGAINESLADTMAATVDTDDWLVGEDIVAGSLRDMSLPKSIGDFVATEADNGGVHSNSAIPNYAAFRIGDVLGRDTMGKIYARTMDKYLSKDMTFKDLAAGTWRATADLYGEDSTESAVVRATWDSVLRLDGDTSIYTVKRQPDRWERPDRTR